MWTLILVIHVMISAALVGLILIQHGKGADAGAAFGSGASGTLFGARGSGSFLSRTTAILATLFFVTSLTMAYMSTKQSQINVPVPTVKKKAPAPETGKTPVPGGSPAPGGATGQTPVPGGGEKTASGSTPAAGSAPAPASSTGSAPAPAGSAPAPSGAAPAASSEPGKPAPADQ